MQWRTGYRSNLRVDNDVPFYECIEGAIPDFEITHIKGYLGARYQKIEHRVRNIFYQII